MSHEPEFPPTKLRKYPHMFALDITIWERFIDAHAGDFDGFDYDIKVGSGTKAPESFGDNYKRMVEILSKYRIDAVGFKSDAIHIIEVKPEAGTIAIGQIALYSRLYKRDFNPSRRIVGTIVTDRELPDIKFFTEEQGIELFVMGSV